MRDAVTRLSAGCADVAGRITALSDRYRVIAPDLRGFGRSHSTTPFTIRSLAEDVRQILRQMNALPCVLGGLSMGGYITLAYEQMCPTDLKGLILLDTKAEADSTDAKANRERSVELARTSGAKAVADQMLPRLLSPNTLRRQPQVVQTLREMMESVPVETITTAQHAMRDRQDMTTRLPSIADPALIVVGEDDAATPPTIARQMQQCIPRSLLAVIPQAGHLSPVEQPQLVSEIIRTFLDTCYAP